MMELVYDDYHDQTEKLDATSAARTHQIAQEGIIRHKDYGEPVERDLVASKFAIKHFNLDSPRACRD